MKTTLPSNIAIDRLGLLFNGERLPFYISTGRDLGDACAQVVVEDGISFVTVTFPADSVTLAAGAEVDAEGRVCLRDNPEFEDVA